MLLFTHPAIDAQAVRLPWRTTYAIVTASFSPYGRRKDPSPWKVLRGHEGEIHTAREQGFSVVHLQNMHHVCPWRWRWAVGARFDGFVRANLQGLAPELGDLVYGVATALAAALGAAAASHVARATLTTARQLSGVQAGRAAPAAPAR